MIPIPFAQTFSIFVGIWFVLLALLWLFEELRQKKAYDWTIAQDRLYLCGKCRLSFLAKHDTEHVTRCPRCNEMCFLRRRKRF